VECLHDVRQQRLLIKDLQHLPFTPWTTESLERQSLLPQPDEAETIYRLSAGEINHQF